jgi:hypothetical protein
MRRDYMTLGITYGWWAGATGHFSIDRYDRFYFGFGPYLGSPGFGVSYTLGGLDQDRVPTERDLQTLLDEEGWSWTGGYAVGYGRSWSGPKAATDVGITTEGGSLSYQKSYGPWQLPQNPSPCGPPPCFWKPTYRNRPVFE